MTCTLPMQSEIWGFESEIWPDFAKSEILAQSGIWFFYCDFRGLVVEIQIADGGIRNLIRNLDFFIQINALRQIPDFGNSPPKGVGGLPRKGGGPPPTPGRCSRAEVLASVQSDDGGFVPPSTSPPSSSTRAANQEGDHSWLT